MALALSQKSFLVTYHCLLGEISENLNLVNLAETDQMRCLPAQFKIIERKKITIIVIHYKIIINNKFHNNQHIGTIHVQQFKVILN